MNNVYLIGYRGTGKTTLAPLLAASLGYASIEMDDRIAQEAGMSVADIFKTHGEAHFRQREARLLLDLSKQREQVISTGGGIVVSEDNRVLMRDSGTVVWLHAPLEVIITRLGAEGHHRPALTTLPLREEITRLVAERTPWYAATAHYQVDTGGQNMDDSLAVILHHLKRT
jgi:shikimate kinase